LTLEHVQDVLACPSCRLCGDDYSKTIEYIDPAHIYLLCDGGFFLFIPRSRFEYDAHVAFKRSHVRNAKKEGVKAKEYMSGVCRKITCQIPVNNKLAIRYARGLGFKFEGINKRSHMWGGVLIDKLMLGMEV